MRDLLSLNRFFLKYRGRVLLGITFVMLSNYFGLLPARITRKALDFIMLNVHGDVKESTAKIILFALSILGVVLMKGLFLFFMRQTIIVMSRLIEYDMKNEIFSQYQKLDLNFYLRSNTGDLMNKISEDVSRVRMYTGPALMYTINILIMIVMVFIAMSQINLQLTIVVLLPLPILVGMIYYVQRIINTKSEQVQETLSDLSTNVQETFSGIRIIKSFAKESLFGNLFEKRARSYFSESMKLARVHALFYPAIVLLVGLSSIMVIYYGGILVNQQKITYGNVAEFVIYLNLLMWPVGSLGWIITLVQRADASQRRINEFLLLKPQIQNPEHPLSIGNVVSIEFKNVSYRFPNQQFDAVSNLSFQLNKGQVIAIIGTTGSGKSTLANLLARLIDPIQGNVYVNGHLLSNLDVYEWRKQIGFVTQDVLLFSDTIRNNIAFGISEDIPFLEQQIIEASKNAFVYDEVMLFKNGFETVLGERGISISGGQKQRVSIARALIKNPDLLILDDCLSAVDTQTEEGILLNLLPFLKKRMTLILGHRISSVKYADMIIVMDQGRIIEKGSHNQLLNDKGHYARLAANQLKENAQQISTSLSVNP
jgi:ATP-binding cassette subfamily B protein